MRQISSGEALRELSCNKDYLHGCIYTAAGTNAIFSVRRGKLEVREPDIFLEADNGSGMMRFLDSASFALAEPSELPSAQRMGSPPLAEKAIRVVFANKDVCFIFPER
jgi:hypothetical protein